MVNINFTSISRQEEMTATKFHLCFLEQLTIDSQLSDFGDICVYKSQNSPVTLGISWEILSSSCFLMVFWIFWSHKYSGLAFGRCK